MVDKLNWFQIIFGLIIASYLGGPAGLFAGILYQARLTGITEGTKNLSAILFGIGIGCLVNAMVLKVAFKEKNDKKINQN